jgi:hypothetical protein
MFIQRRKVKIAGVAVLLCIYGYFKAAVCYRFLFVVNSQIRFKNT